MLANVVNALFELAVEFKGFGDEAVMSAGHGDRGLVAASDNDQVVRSEAHDKGFDPTLPLDDVGGEDAGHRRRRRGACWHGDTGASGGFGGLGLGGYFHGGVGRLGHQER